MTRQGPQVLAILERDRDDQITGAADGLARLLDATPLAHRVHPATRATDETGRAEEAARDVLAALRGDGIVGAALTARGEHPVLWEVLTRATVPLLVIPQGCAEMPRPIKQVLLALNGSEHTTAAVAALTRCTLDAGVEVTALHVFDPATTPAFWDSPAHSPQTWTREFLRRRHLEDVDLLLRRGQLVPELVRAATGGATDLIVLGWHQDLSAGHGSTVRELVRAAPVPLLLVGPGTFASEG